MYLYYYIVETIYRLSRIHDHDVWYHIELWTLWEHTHMYLWNHQHGIDGWFVKLSKLTWSYSRGPVWSAVLSTWINHDKSIHVTVSNTKIATSLPINIERFCPQFLAASVCFVNIPSSCAGSSVLWFWGWSKKSAEEPTGKTIPIFGESSHGSNHSQEVNHAHWVLFAYHLCLPQWKLRVLLDQSSVVG